MINYMPDTMSALKLLQQWYKSQCDGDWEHRFGIHIETLDNPGWLVKIDLEDTAVEDKPFLEVKDVEPELHWIHCELREGKFVGAGGPEKLEDIVDIFLKWANQH
jgi:hypothetical protein